jgi:DNA-binding ferritin-like protein (Dps family)
LALQVKLKNAKRRRPAAKRVGDWKLMKLMEEILLPNGLKLNIFDRTREIAAKTVKVEIAVQMDIGLKESFFTIGADYQQVKNIFGDNLVYEYKLERAYIQKESGAAVRGELLKTFKNNMLPYLGKENFAQKYALSLLRDIQKNPYKYSDKADIET